MNDKGIDSKRGALDPHGTERRKFFATRVRGLDRKGAGHGAWILATADRAEKTGSLEGRYLGKDVGSLRRQDAEARKANIPDIRWYGAPAEIKYVLIIDDPARLPR